MFSSQYLIRSVSIPVIAYSPVGRGWLASRYRSLDDVPQNDMRRMFDRFKPDVVEQNLKFVHAVQQIAERKGLQTSQVAIAWVARQGAIPIPGSSNLGRVTMNSKLEELSDEDMADLQKAAEIFPVAGKRYGGVHEKLLNR
jgi:pyridoxine 4-dehydrogenase